MDDSLKIRTFQPENDFYALTELINAIQGTVLTMDQVKAQISWPGHDLTRDRFVAIQGDQLVGMSVLFSQSRRRIFGEASVHPRYRRLGIGRALIDRVILEARQRGAEQVSDEVLVQDEVAQAFAKACGFQMMGEYRMFTAPADLAIPEIQLPEGFILKSGTEYKDLQLFADACNRCYQDMWGHMENLEPLTMTKIREWQGRSPNILRPEGMFVLFSSDSSPVGVVRADQPANPDESPRVIDAPGVAPEFRSMGLQRPLVAAAMGYLKDQGSGRYQIETWGDSLEAARVYEALGFTLDEASRAIEFVKFLK